MADAADAYFACFRVCGGEFSVDEWGLVKEIKQAGRVSECGIKYKMTERLNVQNGLSFSRLHDAAFDQGLITFDDNLRLLLSPRLKAALPLRIVADSFGLYEGCPLHLPEDAILPSLEFLATHRESCFQRSL